jgi:hypothetical protein
MSNVPSINSNPVKLHNKSSSNLWLYATLGLSTATLAALAILNQYFNNKTVEAHKNQAEQFKDEELSIDIYQAIKKNNPSTLNSSANLPNLIPQPLSLHNLVSDIDRIELRNFEAFGSGIAARQAIKLGELICVDQAFTMIYGGKHEFKTKLAAQQALALQMYSFDSKRFEKLYYNEENKPRCDPLNSNDSTLLLSQLVARIINNCFEDNCDPANNVITMGFLQSRFNHSCKPNCIKINDPNQQHIYFYAAQDIPAGSQLFLSYLSAFDLYSPSYLRQSIIRNNWQFTCNCSQCVNHAETDKLVTKMRREPENNKAWQHTIALDATIREDLYHRGENAPNAVNPDEISAFRRVIDAMNVCLIDPTLSNTHFIRYLARWRCIWLLRMSCTADFIYSTLWHVMCNQHRLCTFDAFKGRSLMQIQMRMKLYGKELNCKEFGSMMRQIEPVYERHSGYWRVYDQWCNNCWKALGKSSTSYHCSGCEFVCYCSEECQQKDWREIHEQQCQEQQQLYAPSQKFVNPHFNVSEFQCNSHI